MTVPQVQATPVQNVQCREVPTYSAVQIIGTIYEVVGVILIIGGIVAFLWTNADNAQASFKFNPFSLIVLLGAIISGVFLIGTGQLYFCVRDMARNSFARADN